MVSTKRIYRILAVLVLAVMLGACAVPAQPGQPVQVEVVNAREFSSGSDLGQPSRGTIERGGVLDTGGMGIVSWGGDLTLYSDAGSTATFAVDTSAGDLTLTGNLTAAEWTAPGVLTSTASVALTDTNEAGGSANPLDITAALGIMNGSDAYAAIDINLTNADHTGSSNTVRALDIAGVTADAHATEAAIYIAAGWDLDLDAATSLEVGVDDVAVMTIKDPAGIDGAATTELVEVAGTTPADTTGTNTHNFITVDAAIGNASGGTNSVRGLQIDGITGDAQVTETAINIDTGWDVGVDLNGTPLYIGADGGVILDEASDDAVTLTTGAGAGTFSILVGNLKVGNGTPGTAQDGEDAYVEGGLEVDGTAKLDGAVNIAGLLTGSAGAAVDGFVTLTANTAVVVGAGDTITPTGTYQEITSAGAVTCSTSACIADGTTDGDLLILRNGNAANTITIDGTGGNVECKTDVVLGAEDTLMLLWNGADWVCLSGYDNS